VPFLRLWDLVWRPPKYAFVRVANAFPVELDG